MSSTTSLLLRMAMLYARLMSMVTLVYNILANYFKVI